MTAHPPGAGEGSIAQGLPWQQGHGPQAGEWWSGGCSSGLKAGAHQPRAWAGLHEQLLLLAPIRGSLLEGGEGVRGQRGLTQQMSLLGFCPEEGWVG